MQSMVVLMLKKKLNGSLYVRDAFYFFDAQYANL